MLEKGATFEEVMKFEKYLNKQFPESIRNHFLVSKGIEFDGFRLILDEVFVQQIIDEECIILGTFFKEADGDLLILKDNIKDEKIYYYSHYKNELRELASNITELFNIELLSYIDEIL